MRYKPKNPPPEFGGDDPIQHHLKYLLEANGCCDHYDGVLRHALIVWDIICESKKNTLQCARCKNDLWWDEDFKEE